MVAFFIYIACMFSTPTIPTDSLYKFLFVGGIVLILLSSYIFIQDLQSKLQAIEKRDSSLNTKFLNDIEFGRTIDSLETRIKKKDITESLALSILTRNRIIAEKSKLDLVYIKERYNNYIEFLGTTNYLSLLIFLSGAFITAYGRYKWQSKIQDQQDRLLQIQLELAELDLKEKRKGV